MSNKLTQFFHLLEQAAPFVLPNIPGFPSELTPFVVAGAKLAEQAEGATGDQKLQIAVQEVNNGIAALNTTKPGTVDPSLVNAAVVNGINATIAAVNIFHKPAPSTPPTA